MTRAFNGKIATDVRDSEQDWDAYNQVTPPEGCGIVCQHSNC